MSELRAKIDSLIDRGFQQRPTTITGELLDYDRNSGLCTVEALSPTTQGSMKFTNLTAPTIYPNVFAPDYPIGSQVNLVFPGGNPHLAQIVSIKPPDYNHSSDRARLARERTFVPQLVSQYD